MRPAYLALVAANVAASAWAGGGFLAHYAACEYNLAAVMGGFALLHLATAGYCFLRLTKDDQ